MDSPIDDAIAEAKAQASRLPVVVNAPARKLTMSDLEAGSLDVESWLQVDKYGLHLDKSQEALEAIEVEIDMSEIVPVYMVRFGKNPPNYCRSYDGVTTFGSPKPWEFTLREAQHLDADCRGQYPAVEIPMTLIDGVELKRDRKTIEGGTRIGYTTSITGPRDLLICLGGEENGFEGDLRPISPECLRAHPAHTDRRRFAGNTVVAVEDRRRGRRRDQRGRHHRLWSLGP
jgi:hypothetical protein